MLYAFIGAAIVIGLLIGVAALSVAWLSEKVSKGIRNRTIDLISSYDDLIDEKSRQLKELNEQIKQAEEEVNKKSREDAVSAPAVQTGDTGVSAAAILNAAERISAAPYRDQATGETYRKIRSSFNLRPEDVLQYIPHEYLEQGPATKLLKELTYEIIYQLSTLRAEDQYALLMESVGEANQRFLTEYHERHKEFHAIGFYDYLKEQAANEPQPMRIYIAAADAHLKYPEEAEVIIDEDICEGFQLEVNHTLYDYCIKGREIS